MRFPKKNAICSAKWLAKPANRFHPFGPCRAWWPKIPCTVLEFVMPQGAMYLFARVNDDDGTALAERLLEHGVAVAPGEAFGDYRNYIRISACQNEKKLIKGMNIINDIRDKND